MSDDDFYDWLLSAVDVRTGRMRADHRLVHSIQLQSQYPWSHGTSDLPSDVVDPVETLRHLNALHIAGRIRRELGPERDTYSGQPPLMIQVEDWEQVRPRRAPIPDKVRQAVYESDGHRCVSCGVAENLSLDHIHPWSKGGSDEMHNLQTMCRPCNSAKSNRTDWEAA